MLLVSAARAPQAANQRAAQNAGSCATSPAADGSYSVTVCLSEPASEAMLAGNTPVSATVSSTGPAAQLVIFSLDGAYLLSDYSSPYTFTLRTSDWVDGSHALSVSATLKDGFASAPATRAVTFNNGVTVVPANSRAFQPTSGRAAASGEPFVVAAAGDGASGQSTSAKVASMLKAANPNLFLYLGDVYANGTLTEFLNWYDEATYFGALRAITDPTVGNHEYLTPGANGYYSYWDNIPEYYSFNAGGWHFVSLNSNAAFVPTVTDSAQYNWLKADLSGLPPHTCTIAYYHHPLFNVGPQGSTEGMTAAWQLMAQYHVAIVLNGHDHNYQRWKPLDGDGNPSSTGITEFVVGSGGHGLQDFVNSDSRVAYDSDSTPTAFGALFLKLQANGAAFRYESISGRVLDAGSVPCTSPAPTVEPTATPAAPQASSGILPTVQAWLQALLARFGLPRGSGSSEAQRSPTAAGLLTWRLGGISERLFGERLAKGVRDTPDLSAITAGAASDIAQFVFDTAG